MAALEETGVRSIGKEVEPGEREHKSQGGDAQGAARGSASPNAFLSQGPSSTLGLVPGLNPASDSPRFLINTVSFIQDTLSIPIPQQPCEVYHHLQAG